MNKIESKRFERVVELFDAARCMQAPDREAFLKETCRDSPDILTEVRRLLAVHEQDDGPLDSPISPPSAWGNREEDFPAPEQIAGYRVIRQVGTGGMGAVYLAQQDKPRRNVALKVIHPGLVSRELQRRFELEAAVLGRLDHPGIAQIHEAGMFDRASKAQPFFAMEYVDGPPLLEFVKQSNLDLHHQLELAASICDAVHHAHQKGVIHRDLKPGNILVRKSDSQPKILDFGVARATDFDLQITTIQTGVGQLIGTLQYMSPEQVEGNARSVDTRSDVYSLGVILYEMLTGQLPYDLTGCSIAGAAKMIVEAEPASLNSISRTLRGDLNTIVMKALEKDPAQRYQSASDLAADIRSYLNNRPIAARAASTIYQMKKFASRNRALVAGVVIAFLAVAAGAVFATIGMVRAQRQADRSHAMNDFLESVLIAADSARRGDMRLVDLLKDASGRVDTEFAGYPDLLARVHRLLAIAFHNTYFYREAEFHARRWLTSVESEFGKEDPRIRAPRMWIALALRNNGKAAEAEQVLRAALEVNKNQPRDIASIDLRNAYGSIIFLLGRYDEAEQVLREVIKEAEDLYGRQHRVTISATFYLARTLDNRAIHGRDNPDTKLRLTAEAVDLYYSVIDDEQHADGQVNAIAARIRLSDYYSRTGDFDQAYDMASEVLDKTTETFGENHPRVREAEGRIAKSLFGAGRVEEAATKLYQSIERQHDLEGLSVDVIVRMADAIQILNGGKQYQAALKYAQILANRYDAGGPHGELGIKCRIWIAYLYTRLGEPERSVPLFDELFAIENQMGDLQRAMLHFAKGAWCAEQGELEMAREHLEIAVPLCGSQMHHWPKREAVKAMLKQIKTPANSISESGSEDYRESGTQTLIGHRPHRLVDVDRPGELPAGKRFALPNNNCRDFAIDLIDEAT